MLFRSDALAGAGRGTDRETLAGIQRLLREHREGWDGFGASRGGTGAEPVRNWAGGAREDVRFAR